MRSTPTQVPRIYFVHIPTPDRLRFSTRQCDFFGCGANLIAIANNTDSPAVTEYGLNFLCQAQNPYFFNSMSVPIHFAEILAYCIGAIMGKKSSDIMHTMDAVGNYFRHNKL